MSSPLSAAVDRFIAEERPDLSREAAIRLLVAEALIGMGILAPPTANRSRGARASAATRIAPGTRRA